MSFQYEITIYCDGACDHTTGRGGWSACLFFADGTKYIYGNEVNTTNNRMELTAVIKAMELLAYPCIVHLYTDSQYVIYGIRTGINIWPENAWVTCSRTSVANKDLWERIQNLLTIHQIVPHWVKGHAGNTYNEIADSLAVYARNALHC